MTKPFYLSKTFWLSLLLAVCGVVGEALATADVPAWVLSVIGAVTMVLRAFTSQPVSVRAPKAQEPLES